MAKGGNVRGKEKWGGRKEGVCVRDCFWLQTRELVARFAPLLRTLSAYEECAECAKYRTTPSDERAEPNAKDEAGHEHKQSAGQKEHRQERLDGDEGNDAVDDAEIANPGENALEARRGGQPEADGDERSDDEKPVPALDERPRLGRPPVHEHIPTRTPRRRTPLCAATAPHGSGLGAERRLGGADAHATAARGRMNDGVTRHLPHRKKKFKIAHVDTNQLLRTSFQCSPKTIPIDFRNTFDSPRGH